MHNSSIPTAIKLVVNGKSASLAARDLSDVLAALGYEDTVVATAINGDFVPARKRAATPVQDGDRIEILAPRQGG